MEVEETTPLLAATKDKIDQGKIGVPISSLCLWFVDRGWSSPSPDMPDPDGPRSVAVTVSQVTVTGHRSPNHEKQAARFRQ